MENNEFKALATSMANHTSTWKTEAKNAILKVTELEAKLLCIEIIIYFAKSAHKLAKLFLLEKDPNSNHSLAPVLLHYGLQHCKDKLLLQIHAADNHKVAVDCDLLFEELPAILNVADLIAPCALMKIKLNPIINSYTALLLRVFHDSWNSQLTAHQSLASEHAMAWEVKTYLDGAATEAAAMVIDAEPSADPKILRDLIRTQVQNDNKKLHAEVNRLKQMLQRAPPGKPNNRNRATMPKNPLGGPRIQTVMPHQKRKHLATPRKTTHPPRIGKIKPANTSQNQKTETPTTLWSAPMPTLRATQDKTPLPTTRRNPEKASNERPTGVKCDPLRC